MLSSSRTSHTPATRANGQPNDHEQDPEQDRSLEDLDDPGDDKHNRNQPKEKRHGELQSRGSTVHSYPHP